MGWPLPADTEASQAHRAQAAPRGRKHLPPQAFIAQQTLTGLAGPAPPAELRGLRADHRIRTRLSDAHAKHPPHRVDSLPTACPARSATTENHRPRRQASPANTGRAPTAQATYPPPEREVAGSNPAGRAAATGGAHASYADMARRLLSRGLAYSAPLARVLAARNPTR